MPKEDSFTVLIEFCGNSVSAEMEVALYIYRYGNRLEAQRVAYVRDSGPVTKIRKDYGEEQLTRHAIWVKRWRHCGRRGMPKCLESWTESYILLVYWNEEVGYEP